MGHLIVSPALLTAPFWVTVPREVCPFINCNTLLSSSTGFPVPLFENRKNQRQIEKKSLRMMVHDMKDRLLDGEVKTYQWLPIQEMWADIFT